MEPLLAFGAGRSSLPETVLCTSEHPVTLLPANANVMAKHTHIYTHSFPKADPLFCPQVDFRHS